MTKSKLIITIFIFLQSLVQGQNGSDSYEIRIGDYSFKTKDLPYFETKKSFTINISTPQYVRRVSSFDPDGNEHKGFDTTDHFLLTKLMDSISLSTACKLIEKEVELFCNGKKLKVGKICVQVFRSDGKFIFPQIESNKMSSDARLKKYVKNLAPNSYIILDAVYYYPVDGQKVLLSDKLGWKIISKN